MKNAIDRSSVRAVLVLALGASASSCASSGWDGEVQQWGTVKEVLRDGQTEGKVSITEAAASESSVGIGALAGLEGEVVVFEGEVYTGRVIGPDQIHSTKGLNPGEQAAFLAIAEVEEWSEQVILQPQKLEDVEKRITSLFAGEVPDSFPFVIEGELFDVHAHVLNGRCPYNPDDTSGGEPVTRHIERAYGRLVGFYTEAAPGSLTHHGSKTHVHVILAGENALVGHVDAVSIPPGCTVLVPASP